MAKLYTYVAIMGGLILLFYFTGLIQDCDTDGLCTATTPNGVFLSLLLNPETLEDSPFGAKALAAIQGLALVGAVILSRFVSRIELAIISPLVVYLFNFSWDFLAVFSKVKEANPVLAILIFGPFLLLLIPTIMEYWRGTD